MDRLELAYKDFDSDIERIKHLVDLVKSLREFGAIEIEDPDRNGSDEANVTRKLWSLSKERRTDIPLLSGSLMMYMAGRFEYFVRQLVEITAEEMALNSNGYENLPERYREHLKVQTLDVVKCPRRYGYDEVVAEEYLKNFAELIGGDYDSSNISAALLSLTDSNLKSRMLADITKRLGMENLWKDVGKQASLKLALDTADDKETTQEAQSKLDALMDERNSLAHPTGAMTFPEPGKVIDTAEFLSALSQALCDLMRVYLVKWNTD